MMEYLEFFDNRPDLFLKLSDDFICDNYSKLSVYCRFDSYHFYLSTDHKFIFMVLAKDYISFFPGAIWAMNTERLKTGTYVNGLDPSWFLSFENLISNVSKDELKKYLLFNLDISSRFKYNK